jgi:hypothetical protein
MQPPTTNPPRTLSQRNRPPEYAELRKALLDVVTLFDQNLVQPPVTLTASGHRHVGELLAQARSVLARSRGQGAES